MSPKRFDHPGRRLRSRAPAAAALAAAALWAWAGPAAAHGVGGRTDLPVPAWQLAWAAAFAVAASFVALGMFWDTPKFRAVAAGRILPRPFQVACRVQSRLVAAVGLLALAVLLYAGLAGNTNPSVNIAPVAVYIVFWVGLQVVSVLVGDVWSHMNPFRSIADASARLWARLQSRPPEAEREAGSTGCEISGNSARPWPERPVSAADRSGDHNSSPGAPDADPGSLPADTDRGAGNEWWAVAAIFGFVWLELALHDNSEPRVLGVYLAAYTAALLVGAAVFGRGWLRDAEGFGVLFTKLSAMAPLHRDGGALRLRAPLAGLAVLPMRRGSVAFILVVLGSTTFDGFTRSSIWLDIAAERTGWGLTAVNTVGMVFIILVVAVLYRAAIAAMAAVTGDTERELAEVFAPALLPIAAAYTVAHYFSYLLLEGQQIIALVSDPFGRGRDFFGTATYLVDYTLISTDAIAWTQTAAIAVGHVLAVAVAHDRAVERWPRRLAVRSQYPMLAVMVCYTVIGLLLLLGA
ncbi:MAG: hypothetical protein OXC06_18690 [Acidimicrobiaceae bacterium]|nr:hypothetical protein [Acidimicrobiaceae bacterium]